MTNAGQDRYRRIEGGREVDMHRCEGCWRTGLGRDIDGRVLPAVDNGFVPAERRYPHAKWCQHKGQF